jgi:hypothetical protein
MDEVVEINAEQYQFVKARRNETGVYVSRDRKRYVRVGPKDAIEAERRFHERLIAEGYPVSKIIEAGELVDGRAYFIEASVGGAPFGPRFLKECREQGAISSEQFEPFFEIVKKYLETQKKQTVGAQNWESVYVGMFFETLLEELPGDRELILACWEKIRLELKDIPFVLCHGDFNAFNILPDGVVDFEHTFEGPLGFDLVTIFTTPDWFPISGDYEFSFTYRYSEAQKERIWNILPELKKYEVPLSLLRAVWLCVRMYEWPKIQEWRYNKFREEAGRFLQS